MPQDLGQILSNEQQTGAVEAVEAPAQAEPEVQAAPEGVDEGASPAQAESEESEDDIWRDPPEGEHIPRHVYVATRNKMRDKLRSTERLLAEKEGQIAAYSQMQPKQQEQEQPAQSDPSSLEAEYWDNPVEYTKKVAMEASQRAEQLANQRFLQLSANMARTKYEDYDKTVQAFGEAVQANPALEAMCLQSDNPAEFAYQNGKIYMEAAKHGGSLEKIKESIRQQVIAEMQQKAPVEAAKQATISSAGARGSGAKSTPVFAGPRSLGSILPGGGL